MRLSQAIVVLSLSSLCPAKASGEPDPSDGLQKALALHDSGRYQEAIELYRTMLRQKPDDPRLLYEISFSYMTAKDPAHCIEYARRASVIPGKIQAGALAVLASCQDDSGAHAEALATFARALKQFPKDVRLNFNYAVTLSRTGNLEGARERLRTVIEQAPDYASAYLVYAKLLEADHAIGAAVYMYLRFLTLDRRGGCATGACKKIKELMYAQIDPAKREISIQRPKPVKGESNKMLEALNLALATSAAAAGSHSSSDETSKAVEALTNFVQIGDEVRSSGEGARSFILSHTVAELHALANAGSLAVFLRQIIDHAQPAPVTH